ncbi:MAG: NAD-dependent epimerase/dehydratase family protein [Saprospiraceae bacterium]|nr:NAD-dependent epimerase/dehydratase family protein [Saprospiraceae bacterium]
MQQKVLLTGITGFVGQHCAVELLNKGYGVRGSLRNMNRKEEVLKGLSKVVDSTDQIEFVTLDLMKDEGWDEAMQDIDFVLHVASPYVVREPKDENELIKPAVEGTLRALKAAQKAGVKRVVLTSSIVSMMGDAKGYKAINQDSWTDVNSKNISAYIKSKTIAEREAWNFINNQTSEHQVELAVVNPGPIYGPTLTGNLAGESMNMMSEMIQGKMPAVPQAACSMSDVRDIAKVHVLAMTNDKAAGKRFITTTDKPYAFKDLAKIMKDNGYKKVSTAEAPAFILKIVSLFNRDMKGMRAFLGNTIDADISLTKETLGWEPIAIEKTIIDTAKSVEAALTN